MQFQRTEKLLDLYKQLIGQNKRYPKNIFEKKKKITQKHMM